MKLTVYCGASSGHTNSRYLEQARTLGRCLAQREIELVYGGASVGLMGAVADAVLACGGQVTGVMPAVLVERELVHPGLSHLVQVDDIHQRKAVMMEMADGFIALPGGTGTLEELFEVWAWRQLSLHQKPFGLLNTDGYYDHLLAFLDHGCEQEFIRRQYRDLLLTEAEPDRLLSLVLAEMKSGNLS